MKNNDRFIYHRENVSRHGHRDRDAYFPNDRMGEESDQQPSMFRATAQTDARDFFKGAHEISFPVGIHCGTHHIVGAINAGNNATMLRLAHEYRGTAYLPPIIFIEHRAENHRILVLSDAALAGELVGKAVLKALTKNGKITLMSPSNPRAREWRSRCVDIGKINGRGELQRRVKPATPPPAQRPTEARKADQRRCDR